jgi:hypothetical protein
MCTLEEEVRDVRATMIAACWREEFRKTDDD